MPRPIAASDGAAIRTELSCPGPYQAMRQVQGPGRFLAAADGQPIARWVSGGFDGGTALFAANHLAVLASLRAAILDAGGPLAAGTSPLAEARPGAMANSRHSDMTVYAAKGTPVAHGFDDASDAQTLASGMQALGWLQAAVLQHATTSRADRAAPLSAALDAALAVLRDWQGQLGRRLEFERRLRVATADADQPTGTNGFRNPGWQTGELTSRVCLNTRRDAANTPREAIEVTWAFWGSPEFCIDFPQTAEGAASARRTVQAIWARFAPEADRQVVGHSPYDLAESAGFRRGGDGYYRKASDIRDMQAAAAKGEFSRYDLTLTPDMLADLLPAEAVVRFTPQSLESRVQMLRLGVDAFGRAEVAVPAGEIAQRAANPIIAEGKQKPWSRPAERALPEAHEAPAAIRLFGNRDFEVLDHGALGIEVRFASANSEPGVTGAKWFMDAAGEQIREFITANPVRRAALLLQQRVGEPLVPLPGMGR